VFKSLNSALLAARTLGRDAAVAALQYNVVKKQADTKYGRHKAQGNFKTPGSVTAYQSHERGIIVTSENGATRLTVIAPDCIQVRFQPSGKFQVPFSYAVAKVTWPDVQFSVKESEDTISLHTPELICEVDRATSHLTFKNTRGEIISRQELSWREGELRLSHDLPEREACYGLAAQPVNLDVRGNRFSIWNTNPFTYERGSDPMYYTIPFYLGVHKRFTVGIFWDNPSKGAVDVGAEHKDKLAFSASAGELRYYLFAGSDLKAVLARYTELTGRMPLPPVWALGFHISRWSYSPADQVRSIAQGFRQRNIPCDVIYLDIDYMDNFKVFTWDRERFQAPAILLGELSDQGFKTVVALDPGVKIEAGYKVYDSGLRDGVFVKYPNGKNFVGPVLAGNSVFPDFTNPKSRAWWATQFDPLMTTGVAGIWNDMNEPTVFNVSMDREMPEGVCHDFESQNVSHLEAHNVYGMLMARASREALEKARPGKRPFNITRAAHAGAQRYASVWTGDNMSTWDHLRLNISMVINSGLSGLAFNGADVGGFAGNADGELLTRWIQLGAMMPFFRIHTARDTTAQEPWAFGQPYENIARKYIELRYQLLPYFYSIFAQSSQNGWPILNPLFVADPNDDRLRGIEDAFLVGESLLVAPILEKGQTEREIYLPRGPWFDFHTNQQVQGGQTVRVQAPLDTMPLFVRGGHVIPVWPVQQFVGQVPLDELRLKVYAGEGEVTLYEDAGEGMEYISGNYRWLYFTCKRSPGNITISWRRAGKYKPPYERVRCEVFGLQFEPKQVELDGQSAPLWYFENGVVEFTANKPFDMAKISDPDIENASSPTLLRSPFKGH
jgi:alpha-glucosidase